LQLPGKRSKAHHGAMPNSEPHDLTLALKSLRAGDEAGLDHILQVVYSELQRIARNQMSKEKAGHTLQPTALVHEAYLRLVDDAAVGWQNRAHFFAVAARAMRQILVDHARRRDADKRGGDLQRVSLQDDLTPELPQAEFEFLDLHEAIEKLSALDAGLGRMVELRFFGGLTLDETAEVLGLSRRKVAKDWAFARVWLAQELSEDST
jgi:RNA polymerase sigma factor (TIGR02999 family)